MDALDRKFSSAFVHQRSLDKADPEQLAAARIPVEKSDARFLLLAATKDLVWPSARMTRDIEASLLEAHKGSEAKAIIFPEASHYILGTGSEPKRINPVHKPEGDDPTPEADANATETSWKETKAFLREP
jgi:dienelactone hydrolase